MNRRLLAGFVILVGALFFISLTGATSQQRQHYVFIAFYAVTGLVAARYKAWLPVAVMASVVVLRAFISQDVGGIPLQLASTTFAALLGWLVLHAIQSRGNPTQEAWHDRQGNRTGTRDSGPAAVARGPSGHRRDGRR